MKILFLTPGCFDKGGISRYTRYQISALRQILGERAVRAYSLSPRKADDFEEPFNIHWEAKSAQHVWNKASFSFAAMLETLKWRPDLVWAAHLNLSPLAVTLARLASCKSIVNVYGLELWSGLTRQKRWGLRETQHLVSDCHFSANFVRSLNWIEAPADITVIWDAVDVKRFSPGTSADEVVGRYAIPDPRTGVNILSLGRMTRDASHKGYESLLEAFWLVHRKRPDARLIYAGAGELIATLSESARKAGVDKRVFFLGSIRDQDLPDVYRAASIFSLVSDRGVGRGEGVPVTPIEAAACGVPIIVGNEDGSPEAVVHGETGYVVPSRDPGALADVILSLLDDDGLRARLGHAGRRRAEAEFSYERFVGQHEAFLEKLMGVGAAG